MGGKGRKGNGQEGQEGRRGGKNGDRLRAMRGLLAALFVPLAAAVSLAQAQKAARVERIWNDAALKTWALPIVGVNATPAFYTEAEYYAAPVDELRTYPVYTKAREPDGYREWIRRQGPQPLIDPSTLRSEADWIAAGRDVFDGLHLQEFRTDDPRAFAWADDPDPASHGVSWRPMARFREHVGSSITTVD